ncbi:hypothetical protein Tco_0042891 [Tanacetum coccineum]
MSSAEIDQIVNQRVTAAIVVYETKIRMARNSMNQDSVLIVNQKLAITCFRLGAQGRFKSKCLRWKNHCGDQKEKKGKNRENSKVIKDYADA